MSSGETVLLVLAGVAGVLLVHAGIFFASRRISPFYVVASVILLLAPFSSAPGLAAGTTVKWIRGYALVLLIVMGLAKYRIGSFRAASQAWLSFVVLYVLAGFWGPLPHLALFYKGQVGLVVLGGLFLAYAARDREELQRGLRFLCITTGTMGLVTLVSILISGAHVFRWGRLLLLGTVATRMAADLAPLLLICTYLAMNERAGWWRRVAYASSAVAATVLIATGSRSAAAAVVAGFLVQLLPLVRRRARVLLLPMFVATVGAVVLMYYLQGVVDVERLVSTTNTRAEIWARAVEQIPKAPMFGHGWVYLPETYATLNMHSVYLQVAVEMGLLGLTLFLLCLSVIAYRGMQMYRFVRRNRALADMAPLPLSLIVAALLQGVGETAVLSPTGFAMFMGWSIGLVDCLPQLAIRERWRVAKMMAGARARRLLAATGVWRSPEPTR